MSDAYRRIWDPSLGPHAGAPTSKRIIQDINRLVDETYLSIVAYRGRALYGAHKCEGRRKTQLGSMGGRNHGGVRVKKYNTDNIAWVHPDITHLLDNVVNKYRD